MSVDPTLGRLVNLLYILFSDQRVRRWYSSGYIDATFWTSCVVFGLVLLGFGYLYDPVAKARGTLIREHSSLEEARQAQVDRLLAGRAVDDGLTTLERRVLLDILDFYRHVQWRYADVVLGAPPPTFPLFRRGGYIKGGEDDAWPETDSPREQAT
ncbi:MAG TPA: hypothetical protein VF121_13400 [Thermoanaerobaculia bacterium]|nr:hypothetical protein [Thermoanaerobaculia bacterium]